MAIETTVEYHSRLAEIARTLDRQVDPATRISAERIAAEAADRVPVESGRLKAAIHIEQRASDNGWAVVAGDTDAWYGHIVEFGSVYKSARPFLFPAFTSVRDNVDEIVKKEFRNL